MRAERQDKTEIDWVLQDLIGRGVITLLVGGSKGSGGKSTWLTGMLRATEQDTSYCGLTIQATNTVYLIEEDFPTLNFRCEQVGLDTERVLWLTAAAVRSLSSWEDRIDAAIEEAERIGAGLIVIDSFTHWADLDPEQEWDNSQVSRYLRYLRKATEKGLAVVVVHHFNKGGQYRGATAFKDTVDILCEFKTHGRSTHRKLEVQGRFGVWDLLVDFDPGTHQYTAVGATEQANDTSTRGRKVRRPKVRGKQERLLAVMPTTSDEAQTESQLIAAYKAMWKLDSIAHGTFVKMKKQWQEDGSVVQVGYPARFYRANSAAQTEKAA